MAENGLITYSVLNPDDLRDMPILEVTGKAVDFVAKAASTLICGYYLVEVETPQIAPDGTFDESRTSVYGMHIDLTTVDIVLNSGKTVKRYLIGPNGSITTIPI